MEVCPCKNCNERQIGCHASCEKFKAWREEYDKQKAKIDKETSLCNSLISYRSEAKWRIFKRYNYKKK